MRKLSVLTSMLALMLAGTAAWGGAWSDYEASFPLNACQDGWLGCIVDGQIYNANMNRDSTGMPTPSSMRVAWNDLEATATFSPFVELSAYTGQVEVTPEVVVDAQDPVDVEPDNTQDYNSNDDQVVASDPPVGNDSVEVTPSNDSSASTRPTSDGSATRPSDHSSNTTSHSTNSTQNTPSSDGSAVRPTTTTTTTTTNTTSTATRPSNDGSAVRPTNTNTTTSTKTPAPTATADAGTATRPTTKPANSIMAVRPTTSAAGAGDTCDNLPSLEPKAMLGKLSPGQTTCLEGRLSKEAKQTTKDKISRVLMANAYASGNKRTWEKLIKRHLDEIDRSDPDLCYKYALHLSKKGVSRSNGVIRWADVALENKSLWTGSVYKSRVYQLYKLKSSAAQKLWKAAEDKYSASPSPELEAKKARTTIQKLDYPSFER